VPEATDAMILRLSPKLILCMKSDNRSILTSN